MLEELIGRIPEAWRELAGLLLGPILWIPRLQQVLIGYFLDSSSPWTAAGKSVFFLFPALVGLAAMWCTQLSLYTLPFRSGRARFVSLILLAWWDTARVIWLYWVGIVRIAGILAGWIITLAQLAFKLVVELVRHLVVAPSRSLVLPGVPWIGLGTLLFWCALEAGVFTYTLLPTVDELLRAFVKVDGTPWLTGPILYFLLLLLVMGSFACVQALVDGVRGGQRKFLAQVILAQLFVIFFEVMFLYRGLVEAVMPWIVEQTGARTGPAVTSVLAAAAWVAIRGMTWLLFGQYGTPPLVAIMSREPIASGLAPERWAAPAPGDTGWRAAVDECRQEIEWLHEKGDQLLEYLSLPVLHLLAAALNFGMILTAARPAFALPFKNLKEITETRDILAVVHPQPRRQVTP